MGSSSWTPPQYAKPALTVITVPAGSSSSSNQPTSAPVNYVFDAVFRLTHQRSLQKTQHPVLTGADITDHAYVKPSRLVLEIGMSDSMASYSDGIWIGASTKSISAWQVIKNLQINRTLLTVTTRLDTYFNMLIVDATAPDDNRTLHALKAHITLEENLSASVSSTANVSTRPQTTNSSSGGVIQSIPPNPSQVQQNVVPSTLWPDTPMYDNVPGAGDVSSNSLGQIQP